MAHSYVNKSNVFTLWEESKKHTDQLTDPFPEFERIARNRPAEDSDPAYPNVTDGTTASIIQKTPKRVVQQMPTGIVECDYDDAWLPIVAEFIFLNKILPYANEDYGLFEKAQLIIENGLSFGAGVSFAPFLNHNGYFSPDMLLPYWGDVYLQPGKKSARSCKYIFIRSWWQTEDIEALIKSERKLAAQARKRGEKYESTWDVDALEKIKNDASTKDEQGTTPSELDRGGDNSGIELVTAFQEGVGAKFYTFSATSKSIVRTKTNKDPRGKMPLDWFYGDIDGTNPLGRSIVELVGGLQNLIDADMQAYQYNRALALQPPVVKYGNIGTFQFAPNEVVDARNDPNAKIVPLTVDTQALTNYPELYGLQKSQLLNLAMSPDTSISAEVGNPGFSKTPAGIKEQKAVISVDDNAIRKRFEEWFENWAETAINLYFGERSGTEICQLDDQTALRLRKLAEEGKFDANKLNEKNQLIIDYDEATPALKFRVNASTSKMADDQTKLDGLTLVQKFLDNSQTLQGVVPVEQQIEIYNSFVSNSGVEDPEKLQVDVEEFKKRQEEQQKPPDDKSIFEQLNIKFADLPADVQSQLIQQLFGIQSNMPTPSTMQAAAKVQDSETKAMQAETQARERDFSPEALQLISVLRQLGMNDDLIAEAIVMLEQGASEQQALQGIGAVGATNG